jgi:hypothetical protein
MVMKMEDITNMGMVGWLDQLSSPTMVQDIRRSSCPSWGRRSHHRRPTVMPRPTGQHGAAGASACLSKQSISASTAVANIVLGRKHPGELSKLMFVVQETG